MTEKAQIESRGVINPKIIRSSETFISLSILSSLPTVHHPAAILCSQPCSHCPKHGDFAALNSSLFPPPFNASATQQKAEFAQDLILWINSPANPLALLQLRCGFSPAQACMDKKPQNTLPPLVLQAELTPQLCYCHRPSPASCI